MERITGDTLKGWGFTPAPWFMEGLKKANNMKSAGHSDETIIDVLTKMVPPEPEVVNYRTNAIPFNVFLEPESDEERKNLDGVTQAMDALMRTPTIKSGVVMPDACPAGVIPVGGVVATENAIHPGFHSADACCSMMMTVFKRSDDPKRIMDIAMGITHFGRGGRKDGMKMSDSLAARFSENSFLSDLIDVGNSNMGTQGDGNHFLFVGTMKSTGQPAIVTHHGSRGVGATLYTRGMKVAKKHTSIVSPRTPEGAAWIDSESDEGRAYWEALQLVRAWTKENHSSIHDAIQKALGNRVEDRIWNEHNFVFRKSDGLFYHAKGATPSFRGFSEDDDGRTLIPMNMAEPVLVTRHRDNPEALGFSPHGAGRNTSRTDHMRKLGGGDPRGVSPRDKDAIFEKETKGLDIRAYLGRQDLSELPSAYKSADQVRKAIAKHDLAEIIDEVIPYGSIMAGEEDRSHWKKKKR